MIAYINESRLHQPSLGELAETVSLSRYHFQRLFLRWAGVSPKKFLQCLTVQSAKQQLLNGQSVLDVALNQGLSGPGRLHDLTVLLEAASPGEIKSGGKGWEIKAGFCDSPFGNCLIAEIPRGICKMAFYDQSTQSLAEDEISNAWPNATISWNDRHVKKIAKRIFLIRKTKTNVQQSSIRCFVKGTEFQVKVWRALLQIPAGKLTTYGNLANAIGNRNAFRAVGTAIGQNEIGYLIPCHRVIRKTGVVGDYRWGAMRKQAIVAGEIARNSTEIGLSQQNG